MTAQLQPSSSRAGRAVQPSTSLAALAPLAILVLVALAISYVRVRLLSTPLERDEGEYAYLGQLVLQGRPPFLDAYTMKLPGTAMAYALFMSIFGQTAEAIRLGLWTVNAATACLLWLLTRRLFDAQTAAASAAVFLLLSISRGVQGVFAHATQFVDLFALAGFLRVLAYQERDRRHTAVVAGICFGFAILMKQHAAVPALFAAGFIAWRARSRTGRWKDAVSASALFAAGAAIPLAAIVLWTVHAGTFGKLWFWTVQYALQYAKGLPFSVGLSLLELQLVRITSLEPAAWMLAALGVVVLFVGGGGRDQTARRTLVIGLLLSSFAAMCPGFYFREHYFVLILPAVALLSGLAITKGAALASRNWPAVARGATPAVLLVATLGSGFWLERAYLFERTPAEVSRDVYGPNPFPESVEIADYIRANSAAADRIAVLGSEPEIFFYADRRSATGHIYMYGLMEDQPYASAMQQEAIAEIEASRPLYAVFVGVPYSWGANAKSSTRILDWARDYLQDRYRLVGAVDIGPNRSRYLWGQEAASSISESGNFVTVWRRVGP